MTTDKPLQKLPATLIPGDGIGPEIVKSAVDILEVLGSPFEWDTRQGGLAAIEESHDPLPQATLDSIRRTRLALKGPSDDAGRRRIPLDQCSAARGVRPLR